MTISNTQRGLVNSRAKGMCEYCRVPQTSGTITYHVDHIRPIKHNGTDDIDNLCLSCYKCNGYKGTNIAGYDPLSDEITRLYHPRQDDWFTHFTIIETMEIEGLTAEGRTTAELLRFNEAGRVRYRQVLHQLGEYPPNDNNEG